MRTHPLFLLVLLYLFCSLNACQQPEPPDDEAAGLQSGTAPAGSYDPATARELTVEALTIDDPAAAEEVLERALAASETMVDPWLLLAAKRAARGDADGAFAALERLVAMRVRPPIDAFPPLEPLHPDPRWTALLARLDGALEPVGDSEVVFALPERDLVTEDVAFDAATGSWYVSSVHQRKIVRRDADGRFSDLLAGRDDVYAVFALAVDAPRRRLWATTSGIANMRDFDPALDLESALLEIDLDAQQLVGRWDLGRSERDGEVVGHRLNDLAVAGDGTVYASDNQPPGGLYRLRPGDGELERIGGDIVLRSPQGLALLDGDRLLIVADYSYGLVALDLETDAWWFVEPPADTWMQALDGLTATPEGELIAIQNGHPPHRILRLRLSADHRRVTNAETLARALVAWDEPTLGIVLPGDRDGGTSRFVYIGRSQWGRFDASGAILPDSELLEPWVMTIDLS